MKATTILFDHSDVGCWADGAFGHEHVRSRLASLVSNLHHPAAEELANELRNSPSDDMSEEDEALDMLQERTEDGLVWSFHEGDIVLVSFYGEGHD